MWLALISRPTHAVSAGVDAKAGRDTAEGFGQRHRRAAVQQAGRLDRALVDRHAGCEAILANLYEFDAEMLDHGAGAQVV